jgi:PKD repeat protein
LIAGNNTIDVKVTAEDGTTIKTYTINFYRTPTASAASLSSCDDVTNDGYANFTLTGADATVGASQAGVTITYHASLSDAQNDINTLSSPFTNTTANSQIVYARVENASSSSCYATSELTLTVNPMPTLVSNSTEACGGSTFSFTAASFVSNGTIASWTRNAIAGFPGLASPQTNSGSGDISETIVNNSNFDITLPYKLNLTNAGGCNNNNLDLSVVLHARPLGSASLTSQSICSGETIADINLSITNGVTGPTSYSWTSNNANVTGLTTGTSNPITGALTNALTNIQTKTFTITPIVNGCSGNTFQASVTVNPIPAAPTASNVTTCYDGTNKTATAIVGGGETLIWYDAAANGNITTAPSGSNANVYTAYAIARNTTTSCESATRTPVSLTINALPSTSAITGSNSVCENSTNAGYSVTNTVGSTYAWVITGGTQTSGTNTNSISVNWGANGAGSISVTETNAANCAGTAVNLPVTINTLPSTSAISGSNSVCENSTNASYSLTNTVGSTYAWVITGGTQTSGTNTNSITVTWGPNGAGNVSVTETNAASCLGTTINLPITIHALPTVSASSNSPVCSGQSINLSVNSAATYSWTGPNGFASTVQNPSIPNSSNLMAGSYQVSIVDANGCSASSGSSLGNALSFNGSNNYVNITTGVPAAIQGNTNKFVGMWVYPTSGTGAIFTLGSNGSCQQTLRFFLQGGNLSIDGGCGVQNSSINVPNNEWTYVFAQYNANVGFQVGKVTSGSVSRQSILGGTNNQQAGNMEIGKNSIGNSFFSGNIDEVALFSSIPNDGQIISQSQNGLVGSESGLIGYWKFDEANGSTTADLTSNNLTGTLVNSPSRVASISNGGVPVVINSLPVATISYAGSPYCAVATATVTRTGQAGGTYSSTAGLNFVSTSTGEINLATSTPGTYTITYTFTDGTCSNTATTSVVINALPTATIAYSGSPYCATGTATVTQTGQAGGTYSSTAGLNFVSTATGEINLATSSAGIYTVTYNYNNGTCSNSTTASVTITALPSVASIGISTVEILAVGGGGGAGGPDGPVGAGGGAGGVVYGKYNLVSGSNTFTVAVGGAGQGGLGCNPSSAGGIGGTNGGGNGGAAGGGGCSGGGGGGGGWSGFYQGSTYYVVAGGASGGGGSNEGTANNVSSSGGGTQTSNTGTMNGGVGETFSGDGGGGAGGGGGYLGGSGQANINGGGLGNGGSNYFSSTNLITGNQYLGNVGSDNNSSNNFSVSGGIGTTSAITNSTDFAYTNSWGRGGNSQPNGQVNGIAGAGTNGAVVIRYLGTPQATGGTITQAGGYTLHTFTTPGNNTFTINSAVCVGSTLQLTSATAGGVWSSNNNPVATVDNAGLVSGVSAGSAIITYTVEANGCTASVSSTVNVNPLPTASISGNNTVCRNASSPNITFTGAAGTAPYTFTYTINGGSNQTVTTTAGNSVNVAAPTGADGTFAYNLVSVSDANGCSQNQTGTATIIVNPSATASISGGTSVCLNSTSPAVTFTGASGVEPYTFTYKINGGSNQTVTTTSGSSVTVAAPTNSAGSFVYSLVSAQDGNGCSQSQAGSTTMVIKVLPTASIGGTTQVCKDASSPNVTFTGSNGTAPYTFSYTVNSGSVQTVTTTSGNSVTVAAPTATVGAFVYALTGVEDVNGSSCSQSQTGSTTITVNPLPTATASGSTSICVGATYPNITFTGADGTAPYTFTYNVNGGANQTVTTTSGNSTTVSLGASAPVSFDFNSGSQPGDLTSIGLNTWVFGTAGSGALAGQSVVRLQNDQVRKYLRTNITDYNTKDFTAEVTYNQGGGDPWGLIFFGIGEPGLDGNVEPNRGVFLRLHPAGNNTGDGLVGRNSTNYFSNTFTGPGNGLVKIRLSKTGNMLSFYLDPGNTGNFTQYGSSIDITGANFSTTLNSSNSSIFFGTGKANVEFDNFTISTINNTASTPGTHTFNLVNVADSKSCSQAVSGQSAAITINPLPTASIGGTTAVCKDATSPDVTFTGANGTAPYTFTYNVNGGTNTTVTTTSGNSVTVAAPTATAGSFVYNLVSVQDASSTTCSQTQSGSATITVNPLPTASIGGTTAVCKDATAPNVTFTGGNGTAPYTFTYNINGGSNTTVSTSSGNSVTVAAPTATAGSFVYNLVSVQDASSTTCSQAQTGSATITVNPLPTASISGTTSVCKDASSPNVTFTGANGTAPYTFTYNIDGGANTTVTTSSGNSVTVAAPTSTVGSFVYNLVSIQDASSTTCIQAQSGSATITVNPLPTASISGTTSVCKDATSPDVTFTGANGTAPYTFTYKINGGGDLTVATTSGNSVTVAASTGTAGTFVYSLVSVQDASSTTCSQTQSGSATITVNPLPTAGISGTTAVCKDATSPDVTFTGANGTAPYTFTYNINGGANTTVTTTSGNSVSVTAPTATVGSFVYNLVSVQDASSTTCSQAQTGSATITVNPLPTASISGTTSVCKDATSPNVTFTGANGTSPYTFTYNINGGSNTTVTTTSGNSVTVAASTSTVGSFVYNLVSVQDASSTTCSQTQSGSATITVNPLPTASISGTTAVCKDAGAPNVTFTAAGGTAPYTFTYNINGGSNTTVTTSSGNSVEVVAPTGTVGSFVYNLVSVQDASSTTCLNLQTGSATITIKPHPLLNASTANVCSGSNFSFPQTNMVPSTGTFTWTRVNAPFGLITPASGGLTSGDISEILVNNATVPVDVVYNFSLTLDGCTNDVPVSLTLTVKPKPLAVATPSSQVSCSGSAISDIGLSSLVSGTTFSWTSNTVNVPEVTGIANGTGEAGPISGILTNTSTLNKNRVFTITPIADGCSGPAITAGVTVNPKPVLTSTLTPSAVCSGTNFSYTPTSSTPGATFSWTRATVAGISNSVGSGNNSISEVLVNTTLSPVVVTYEVTSSYNGCSGTESVSVSVNPKPQLSETHSHVSCFGSDNGSIDLTVTGATNPLNYVWTGSNSFQATSEDLVNLAPGTYTVTVTDNNSCVSNALPTVTISQPISVTVSASRTNVTCSGANDGTITVSGVSSGATTVIQKDGIGADLSGNTVFGPGTYVITATAPNGNNNGNCTANTSVTISEPTGIVVSNVAQTTISCNGGNATVTITASGGTGALSYTFDGVTNSTGIFTHAAGTGLAYSVTDANNCSPATGSFDVVQPTSISVSNVSQSTILCNGGNATVTITAAGGTGALSYTFDGVTNSTGIFTHAAGTGLSYSVTDANNCTAATGTFDVVQPNVVSVSNVSQSTINCNSQNATVTITATGGTGALSYTFDGVTNSTGIFTHAAGTGLAYSVTDANNCAAATGTFTVVQPTVVSVSNVSQSTITCNGGNATVTITAAGGTGALSYTFDGVTNSTGIFTHTVGTGLAYSVTDANNCSAATGSFNVVEPSVISVSNVSQSTTPCGVQTTTVTITAAGGTGALSYTFDGVTNNTGVFTHSAGTGLAYSVTDANNCTAATGTFTVIANSLPATPTASLTQPNCNVATGVVTIVTPTPSSGISYTVVGTSPVVSGVNNTTGIFSGLTPGNYDVTTTDNNGCTSSALGVTINAQPITITAPIVGAIVHPTCSTSTGEVALSGLPSTGSWTVTESIGSTTISGTGSTASFTGLAAGTYTFTVSNGSCTSPASGSATINAIPQVASAGVTGTTAVCQNASSPNITFTGLTGLAPYTFTYKINGGSDLTIGTVSGNSVTVAVPTSTAGAMVYSLVSVLDANGCTVTQSGSATVTVNEIPVVGAITYGSPSSCGNFYTFSNTSTGSNLTYAWSFPVGSLGATSVASSAERNFASSPATVNLTVTANGVCSINATPLTFSPSLGTQITEAVLTLTIPNTGSLNRTVDNTGSTGALYYVSVDGNPFIAKSAFPYDINGLGLGSHTIRLVASDLSGGCKDTATSTFTVTGTPCLTVAGFTTTPSSTQALATNRFDFFNTSVVNGFGWISANSWDFGDGTTSTNTHIYGKTYAAAGTYLVTLTATMSPGGCSNSISQLVTVTSPATASFTTTPNTCGSKVVGFTSTSTGATSYLWNFGEPSSGGSNTSTSANPSHTYAADGAYTVTLTLNGSSVSTTQTIYVVSSPVVGSIVNGGPSSCGNSYTFSNVSTGYNLSYAWTFGGAASTGVTSTGSSATRIYSAAGAATIDLVVSADGRCPVSATQLAFTSIVGSSTPMAGVSIGAASLPSTTSVSVNNTSTNATTYYVSVDGGPYVAKTVFPYDITGLSNGSHTVSLKASNGNVLCDDIASQTFSITSTPCAAEANFNITPTSTQPLATNKFDFFNTTIHNGFGWVTSYTWDFGDGSTNGVNTFVYGKTYATAGTFNVTLTAVSSTGCTSVVTKSVTVTPSASAAFSYTQPSCGVLAVPFNSSASVAATSYSWNFGDGSPANTNANPTHTYAAAGSYDVILTINGSIASTPQTVVVGTAPTGLSIVPTFSTCGNVYTFTGSATGSGVTYSWSFANLTGTGGTTGAAVTRTYSAAGLETAILTATIGQCSTTTTLTGYSVEEASSGVTAGLEVTAANACNGTRTINNTGSAGASSYAVSVDGGAYVAKTSFPYDVTGLSVGSHTVSLKAINGSCEDIETTTFEIGSLTAGFTTTSSSCGPTVTFTNTTTSTSGTPTYSWNFNSGEGSSTATSPSYTFLSGGTKTVTLTATLPNGCISTSTNAAISATPGSGATSASFTSAMVVSGPCNTGVQFTSTSTAATSYVWNYGDGTVSVPSTTTGIFHAYSSTGTFVVTLTAYGACNQTSSATANVVVTATGYPVPEVSFSTDNATQCISGNRYDFFNRTQLNGAGWVPTYSWDFGDGTTNNVNSFVYGKTYATPGTYTVTLTGTSNMGCSNSSSMQVTVSALPCSPRIYNPGLDLGSNDGGQLDQANGGKGATGLGKNDKDISEDINLYPNPNNGSFKVELNQIQAKSVSISIVDVLGREVYINDILLNGKKEIELSELNLSAGTYTLMLNDLDGYFARKNFVVISK